MENFDVTEHPEIPTILPVESTQTNLNVRLLSLNSDYMEEISDKPPNQTDLLTVQDVENKNKYASGENADELDLNQCEHEIIEIETQEKKLPIMCCGKERCLIF